ncbi:type I restriction enzyme endonuclease domain-containing protein [Methanomethylovorans sp.]|uniref:type I restriction enzyme endonuclease domain-containing protein n=1 Tax=Methanomethylovorans sp. TaxID=2758717 RepID=UPI003D0C4435
MDWTVRENVLTQMSVLVKRILRKYGFPRTSRKKLLRQYLCRQKWVEGDLQCFRYAVTRCSLNIEAFYRDT